MGIPELLPFIKDFQRNELSDYLVYQKLAVTIKCDETRITIEQIAFDEKKHYDYWKSHTNEDVAPNYIKIYFYFFLIKILGLKRLIYLLGDCEKKAQLEYTAMLLDDPDSQWIVNDEISHEKKLLDIVLKNFMQF
jgi:vacuolar iron transporter family protein